MRCNTPNNVNYNEGGGNLHESKEWLKGQVTVWENKRKFELFIRIVFFVVFFLLIVVAQKINDCWLAQKSGAGYLNFPIWLEGCGTCWLAYRSWYKICLLVDEQ